MSLNGGWDSLVATIKAYRNLLGLAVLIGGIVLAAEDRYLPRDTDRFILAGEFDEKFDELHQSMNSIETEMRALSISMYESQLVQTELAIDELEREAPLSHQEQRRLQELRIKRRTLVDRLRELRRGP